MTVAILNLNKHGVYRKFLINKQHYWPNGCPGAHIDSYMEGKPLGLVKTLRKDMGGLTFTIHCTIDERFVTKLMRTHRILNKVPAHSTYLQKLRSG